MAFKQILAKYIPIDSKNKLNKLLAEVERNFGVFSRDMELDIRLSITSPVVLDYFDRITHEEHPKLEYDEVNDKKKPKQSINKSAKDVEKRKSQKEQRQKDLTVEQKNRKQAKSIPNNVPPMKGLAYISIRSIDDINKIVDYFKAHNEDLTPLADWWIQFWILKSALLVNYKDKMSKAFYNYTRITRKARKIKRSELTEVRLKELNALQKCLEEYKNNNLVKKETKPQKQVKDGSSFSLLQKKEWILDWNCVMFKRGSVVIYARSDLGFKFKPTTVSVKNSIESFNYLKKYLNERLPSVRCSIVGLNLTVIDRINFDSAIQQFAIAARQGAIKTSGRSSNSRSAPMPMFFSQAMSKAKHLSPEEFKKWKSEYIDFLVTQQSKDYKVIPCVERLVHTIGDTTEYAFIFSIECKSGDILIVHENVNPDRSTLLFVVKRANYEKCIRAIYDFLQSPEINKRSSLRDRDIEIGQVGIERYRSINHENLYSWKRIISNYKLHYINGYVFMY